LRNAVAVLVALSVPGCTTFPADPSFGSGTALGDAKTKAAEALVIAWRAFDALLTAVDGLQAAGVLRAGTPKALKVADALERARNALNAATNAVRAGDANSFSEALELARAALEEARAAIGGA
jgi:hypothetical protein